jgi:O-antigen ligase
LALQLGFVALAIYVVLLPFQPFFPPITSGIVAFWLVYVLSFEKERLHHLATNRFAQLFIGYYLLLIVGSFYSSNATEAGLDSTLKITLLLWPLGMATWPELFKINRILLLKLYLAITAISAVALMAVSYFNWNASGLPLSQFYQFTSAWVWIPNHYIALYASFGILTALFLALNKHLVWMHSATAVVIFMSLLVLASVRIQFVALPIALLVSLFALRNFSLARKKLLLLASGFLVVLIAIAFAFPASRQRINETADELRSLNKMVNNKQTNHRVFIWQYGWEVCQEHFWFGTGTGAADAALHEKLKTCDADFWNGHRTYKLAEGSYNYHNEFLQHWATHGIIGLLVFMSLFVAPFWFYGRAVNPLQIGFLVLVAVAFFTESMLERQAGVLFFSFFYALLFVAPFGEQSKNNGKNTA